MSQKIEIDFDRAEAGVEVTGAVVINLCEDCIPCTKCATTNGLRILNKNKFESAKATFVIPDSGGKTSPGFYVTVKSLDNGHKSKTFRIAVTENGFIKHVRVD